ncbi:MAG TPA: 30S ribosomal protein S6e [Candidatus Altiarchaeales archaeon]|nr:30S ribosomal protein S6e [Candidatus Altiarchaeales archaeon]
MEFKIVISDTKTGKSYQRDIRDEKAKRFKGKKIGDEIDGSIIGLTGYTLEITGGSDKDGFPMKKGVHGMSRVSILTSGGVGYRGKKGIRRRKRVRGEVIDKDIIQINLKVNKSGKKSIEELLGLSTDSAEEKSEKTEDKEMEDKNKEE